MDLVSIPQSTTLKSVLFSKYKRDGFGACIVNTFAVIDGMASVGSFDHLVIVNAE